MSGRRWTVRVAVGLAVLAGALCIPECEPTVPAYPDGQPFLWNRDALWEELEQRYLDTSRQGCPRDIDARFAGLQRRIDDADWPAVEGGFFELAVAMGGCPDRIEDLLALRARMRAAAKDASRTWPADRGSRDRLYRLLYGSRAAVEEVLLQLPPDRVPTLSPGRSAASATPSVDVYGVRVHSGDILLSRGGAPTSAFIARGNDYPGNFSHVALVHVGDDSAVSVVEAHIEVGVAIADVERYMTDKKLRILVLRLRPDHPALESDPLLPHRAATTVLAEARQRHIPYDFAMDFDDPSEQFCSEVASSAYGAHGVQLWRELSAFSSPGLARWMAGFGVRHLETQSPSDLEYDPALVVVAEWHDPEALLDDHLDNAVIDAMIEQAETGAELGYARALLPMARVLKGYSAVLNLFGAVGPVPEGMSATVALRARWLAQRHGEIKRHLSARAEAFEMKYGHVAPYWDLVAMAREEAGVVGAWEGVGFGP